MNMADQERLLDNHTHEPVPESQTVSGSHVAIIIIGVAITLPAFLVGSEIMSALGLRDGLLAIFGGGVILALIASACMYVAVSKRLSTGQILSQCFGSLGGRVVSVLISLTLLGWYGVTASLFGRAAAKSVEEMFGISMRVEIYMALGCLLMTVTAIYGFRAIDKLSRLAVPLMLLVLGAGAYFVMSNFSFRDIMNAGPSVGQSSMTVESAISLIVGSFMVALTILPDIARFIRRKKQVYGASFSSFGLFFPLILLLAGLPGVMTGERDIINSLYQSGLGIPALFMIVFATWTTNVSNLYSSSLGFSQIFPKTADWKITVCVSIAGFTGAMFGIMDHLIGFLVFLGIFIPPVAGIYLAHFFNGLKACPTAISIRAFGVWTAAVCVAFATTNNLFSLTHIPALDGLLASILIYSLISRISVFQPRSQP